MDRDPQDSSAVDHSKSRWYALHMLMWGMLVGATSASHLVNQRAPGSPWRGPLLLAGLTGLLWELVTPLLAWLAKRRQERWFPGPPGSTNRTWLSYSSTLSQDSERETGPMVLGGLVCLGVLGILVLFSRHHWAALACGILMAVFLTVLAKARRQSYILAVLGWVAAGLVGSLCDWPGDQSFQLVFAVGGFASVIQAAFDLSRFYSESTERPESRGAS